MNSVIYRQFNPLDAKNIRAYMITVVIYNAGIKHRIWHEGNKSLKIILVIHGNFYTSLGTDLQRRDYKQYNLQK